MGFAAEQGHSYHCEARRLGVLLIHGLSSTPRCMRFLAPLFAQHGISSHCVLLPGHDTRPEDLLGVKWEDWYGAVQVALEELRQRCDRVFVLGQSLGGTLALRAAIHEKVDGVMTLSAIVFLKDWRLAFLPILKPVLRWRHSRGNDIALEGMRDEGSYSRLPLQSVQQLLRLARQTRRELGDLRVPSLVVHSKVDHVAPPENGSYIYERIGAQDKALLRLQKSYHVISLDADRDCVAQRCIQFMHRIGFADSVPTGE